MNDIRLAARQAEVPILLSSDAAIVAARRVTAHQLPNAICVLVESCRLADCSAGSNLKFSKRQKSGSNREASELAGPCRAGSYSPLDLQKEFEIKRQQRKLYEDCLSQMMSEGICFYCGENAYQTDTNIPTALFAAVFKAARKSGIVPDLPICQSCKRIGGRKAFRTPQQKRVYIQRAMRRRDGRYLDVPEWTEKEIAELGYSLQMMVKQGISRKLQLERRLAWPRLRPKARKVPE